MAKLYTLDHKLLTDTPEIRIGEKVYAVDNRTKTVKKIQAAAKDIGNDDPYSGMDKVLELAMGAKAAKEIDEMDLPFPAYQQMFELVMAAVTGEEPDAIAQRFQNQKES
jgi:hypothetical protein